VAGAARRCLRGRLPQRIGRQHARGARDILVQLGGWHHTELERTGAFGIVDFYLPLPKGGERDHRAVQIFARANVEPEATAPDAKVYLGGGATAHGLVGAHNTVGLGFGYVSVTDADQGFIEAFFKWRPLVWFSVEPDLQFYFLGGDTHVVTGLRCKVKL